MSDSPGIIPTFGLRPGTVLGGYQIKRILGRGYEAEVFEAIEIPTGVRRALKIYRIEETDDLERVIHRAWFFERLSNTGSVARYIHLGTGFLPTNGKPAAMLLMELIQGVTIDRYLRTIKGRKLQREQQYLRLLARIAEKIARIHRLDFAVGDFENLKNVIVKPTGEPIIVDLEPGEKGDPNRDFGNDLSELLSLFDLIFPVGDRRKLYRDAKATLEDAMERPFRRDVLKWISKRMMILAENHHTG